MISVILTLEIWNNTGCSIWDVHAKWGYKPKARGDLQEEQVDHEEQEVQEGQEEQEEQEGQVKQVEQEEQAARPRGVKR